MPEAAQARISIPELNAMSPADFTAAIGGVLEHSPHFAERAASARPFASLDEVHRALVAEVDRASEAERLALLRAHPDLADRLVKLTTASTGEQTSAGLNTLTPEQLADFQRLNTAYRERFGFPFIICARLNSKDTILASFHARLDNSSETEFDAALAEVSKIARLRLADLLA
jgi:OHCU decarboxylase